MTKSALKAERRQRAQEAIPGLEKLGYRVRVNDVIGSHLTIFVPGVEPIQWWPGSQRWSDPGGTQGAHLGRHADLRNFLYHLRKEPLPKMREIDPFIDYDDDFSDLRRAV